MIVKVSSSPLKDGRWYEYLIRFVLGGMATVATGVISSQFGASVGGLFLALPAIFCASITSPGTRKPEGTKHHPIVALPESSTSWTLAAVP